ncbi:MAG: SPASM domain-containing protein [Acidobacteriia bacterium]|nr:SPASM domain-containing protein [Terriglobia bacterium]
MRAWNRAKLLWGYLARRSRLSALPVEYIVETTAKCNLYCPMCPRETHKQPKADMADSIFESLVSEAGGTAEHMMLIGLGEPFMDARIFDRVAFCHRHSISTLLSTNGTFLDERVSARVLDSPLEQITLSFDGARKETFEFYRKGAKFEKVRDNFVRFARAKHERRSKLQVVVQMVRMEGNASEVGEFLSFWSTVPGIDQIRIKEDETNLMRPDAGHSAGDWQHPCHYLWRGPMYVKQNGDVYPCCQSYMLDGTPVGNLGTQPLFEIWNSGEMERMRALHAAGRGGEVDVCSRCCTTIPHPMLVAGSLLLHGRTVRRALPWIERLTYLSKLPVKLLRPPRRVASHAGNSAAKSGSR